MRDRSAGGRWTTLGAEKVDVFPVPLLLEAEDLLVEAVPTLDVLPDAALLATDDLVVFVGWADGSFAADLAVELPFLFFVFGQSSVGGVRRIFWHGRRLLGRWRDASIGNDLFAPAYAFLALLFFPFTFFLFANRLGLELELACTQTFLSFAEASLPGNLSLLFLLLLLAFLLLFLSDESHLFLHPGTGLAIAFALLPFRFLDSDSAGAFSIGKSEFHGALAIDFVQSRDDLVEDLVVDELMQVLLIGILGLGETLGKVEPLLTSDDNRLKLDPLVLLFSVLGILLVILPILLRLAFLCLLLFDILRFRIVHLGVLLLVLGFMLFIVIVSQHFWRFTQFRVG